jgi:1,4-alpha-glucan branching enzyme
MQEVNATAYRRNPGIMMIAEESTSWGGVSAPTDGGGLGYGFKWNMGWMNDSLKYIEKDPMYRSHHHGEITFSMLYAYDEKFILPISHDEVVHGKGSLLSKMPGDRWQQLANVRAYLAFMWSHPGKQLLFMGCELGQLTEWNQEAGLDWSGLEDPARASLQKYVSTLNRIYGSTPALWQLDHQQAGFQWIDGGNSSQQVLTFLRFDAKGNPLACVINFGGTPHHDFQLGLPSSGVWEEIVNSDAVEFGGSGVGNFGEINADGPGSHGQPVSATIQVPPLGSVWFRPKASK